MAGKEKFFVIAINIFFFLKMNSSIIGGVLLMTFGFIGSLLLMMVGRTLFPDWGLVGLNLPLQEEIFFGEFNLKILFRAIGF